MLSSSEDAVDRSEEQADADDKRVMVASKIIFVTSDAVSKVRKGKL
jgi:hypothetical protein